MNLIVCPPRGPGSIPSYGGVFQGTFPWLITLSQPVLSQCGRYGSISPEWHHTTCGNHGGRPKSKHGQTMAELNAMGDLLLCIHTCTTHGISVLLTRCVI